jgi:deoxyribose-phosphate aldolase
MDIQKILNATDHTLLRPTATWDEIKELLDEGIEFHCASCCIPPSYVREAVDYVGDDLPICTVIGFPHGCHTTGTKLFETEDGLENGAAEIDMVINLGWVKDGLWDLIGDEIEQIRDLCDDAILKVIIETSELTEREKIHMCDIVTACEADFIKTSTGFASGGATPEDVDLLRRHIGPHIRVKASGGIRTFEDAQRMMELGADRIGASRLVGLARERG